MYPLLKYIEEEGESESEGGVRVEEKGQGWD
jgi:hypothetical protein